MGCKYKYKDTDIWYTEEELKNKLRNENSNFKTLYNNLVNEITSTETGKRVLDRIKKDYTKKVSFITTKYDDPTEGGFHINDIDYGNFSFSQAEYFKQTSAGANKVTISKEEYLKAKEDYNNYLNSSKNLYTLEEQQEEAIVELLGLMTAEKLNATKDGNLISLLKRLLKEIKSFVKDLLKQREVEIDKLPDNLTIGDLADLLAYSNSKLILPGYEVVYTTPDNRQFRTQAEANKHLIELQKAVKEVDLSNILVKPLLSEEHKRRIAEVQKEIKVLRDKLNSKEYKQEKEEKLTQLRKSLSDIENKPVEFIDQEPYLHQDDRVKYGFEDYTFVRVENTESRFRQGLHRDVLGDDYKGYYIHGYNTEAGKPKTKLLKISKEEATAIWKKDKAELRSIDDRQAIFRLNDEIDRIERDSKIQYQINILNSRIDAIEGTTTFNIKDVPKEFKKEGYDPEYDSTYIIDSYKYNETAGKYENSFGTHVSDEEVLTAYNNSINGRDTIKDFLSKNKQYEQSKEIIEEWKKINDIQYDPEEIYSRGQGFYSVVGAYSTVDVNLLFQNLLHHIEDNQKAGGQFAISAFTKPVDRNIGHLEGGGGKIKFVIFPKSEDILWAANTDVYSGSVWDAHKKVSKDKKSELLGVSYTKYPSLNNISSVQPNLADIVDNLSDHHNELGIVLNNNFRLEYDENVPFQTKKLIDNINKILDEKFGKLKKPETSKNKFKGSVDNPLPKEFRRGLLMYSSDTDGGYFWDDVETAKRRGYGLGDRISYKKVAEILRVAYPNSTITFENYTNKVLVDGKNIITYFGIEINTPDKIEKDFIGKQPTKTKDNLKESIRDTQNRVVKLFDRGFDELTEREQPEITDISDGGKDTRYLDTPFKLTYDNSEGKLQIELFKTLEEAENRKEELLKTQFKDKKDYTSQALVNKKIARLKEGAKKYPLSLIRSEVRPVDYSPFGLRNDLFQDDDLPFQKITSTDEKLQTEVDKIAEEIKDTDKSVIVKNVDEYFQIISNHLRNLRERKSYDRLKKIFTTPEGINKLSTLQDILSQAEKVQDSIEGDARKIRAIAQSVVQIDHLTDLLLTDIKDLVKNTNDSIENLHTFQAYLNTLNDWDILLDEANKSFAIGNPTTTKKIGEVKLKIKQIETFIAKNDESGVVKTLQEVLIPASNDIKKAVNEELSNKKQVLQRRIDRGSSTEDVKKDIKGLEQKLKDLDFENKQNVIDFLKGKRGDATIFNTWLESFRDSSDPTISAFATFVKHQIDQVSNKVYKITLNYEKELAPLVKESERLNPASLTEKIIFKDQIFQDGQKVEVLTLLNPFTGYRADYGQLIDRQNELLQTYKETNSEEDRDNYLQAKKERQKFEQDFMHQEFLPEVYEKYKLFDDEIGQELKAESDKIWQDINAIDESYRLFGTELTSEQEDEKEALLLKYKMLGNVNQPEGTPKTGRELEKAQRMQEVRALNRKFYEWKDNANMFEKAKERHSEYILSKGLTSNSPEYEEEMTKWEKDNTRFVIKDEFYKVRDNITREIALITKKFKNEDLQENISELWKTIQSITYGLRDEDGQPIGILIQEKGAERIKLAQEAIVDLQNQITKISGLSGEEQQRMSELFDNAKNGQITEGERVELNELIDKSKAEGLTKREKERLFKLFNDLKELQSNLPTEYYTQVVNNLTTKYGVTILDTGNVIDTNGTVVPFLESHHLENLLKKTDFNDWFHLNHIQVKVFNPETKEKEQKWKRTYQWNRIVPNNPNHYEIKPSLKYSYREIKPQYKTERIVGKTVDNKGNWLPDLSKSDKYKNTKYFNLKSQPDGDRLSKILDIHTNHLLSTQEGLTRNAKLYLDIPRLEKEKYEQNLYFLKEAQKSPGSVPKLIWERIKEKYRELTKFDIQDSRYEPIFEGKYDKDFIKVPVKYTGKLDVSQVSQDLFRSISKYTYSSELNKQMVESLPIARAIARVVEGADEEKSPKNRSNVRRNAIRKILLKEYEGQKSNLDLKKLGKGEKPATATINLAKSLAAWSTIKINIPAAIANVVNATFQNWVNAGNQLFTRKTFGASLGTYTTRFFPAWQRDYIENKLGSLSLEFQLADVWEPVQGMSIQEHVGEKSSQSKIYDALGFNFLFNMRENGEFAVQSRNWIAALSEIKVNLNQDVISLIDAYELSPKGIIKLKDGIDPSWEVGGSNFQRTKDQIQALNRKIHGNYSTYDKTQLEMYAIGSLVMFLKRFFVSMAANRFAAGGSPTDYISLRGTDRFDINFGGQRGYYYQTLQVLVNQGKNGLKDWDLLTNQEKQALSKTTIEAGVILGSLLLLSLMGYSGDDRNKKKKLKDYSWLELQTIYQLDRLYVETKSFINPKSYFDYTFDLQIKTALEKWYKLFTDFISQSEYQSSLKSSKGDTIYQKGDKKWKTQFKRATGIQQMLLFKDNPDEMLKNYDKTVRVR